MPAFDSVIDAELGSWTIPAVCTPFVSKGTSASTATVATAVRLSM